MTYQESLENQPQVSVSEASASGNRRYLQQESTYLSETTCMRIRLPQFELRLDALRQRPLGALLGLREPKGQHTEAEAAALERYAEEREVVVEIGVAEGVSAARLRAAMSQKGNLCLVDPYITRYPISPARTVAMKTASKVKGAKIRWIRSFSYDAALEWDHPIDFLFIDGDHSEHACNRDWSDWSPWIVPGGVVAFHDSAIGPGSPAGPDWGPVRVVDRLFKHPDTRLDGWNLVEIVDSITFVKRQDQVTGVQPRPKS